MELPTRRRDDRAVQAAAHVRKRRLVIGVHARPWLTAAAAAAAFLLAGCGSSSTSPTTQSTGTTGAVSTAATSTTAPAQPTTAAASSGAHSVSASSGGVTATQQATTHQPKVEAPWPIHFTVTRGATPVSASVSYEYLLAGQVVARRSHYTFKGHFSDVFKWPSSAVGYPLTFRAVIVSAGVSIDLDYPVQVVA